MNANKIGFAAVTMNVTGLKQLKQADSQFFRSSKTGDDTNTTLTHPYSVLITRDPATQKIKISSVQNPLKKSDEPLEEYLADSVDIPSVNRNSHAFIEDDIKTNIGTIGGGVSSVKLSGNAQADIEKIHGASLGLELHDNSSANIISVKDYAHVNLFENSSANITEAKELAKINLRQTPHGYKEYDPEKPSPHVEIDKLAGATLDLNHGSTAEIHEASYVPKYASEFAMHLAGNSRATLGNIIELPEDAAPYQKGKISLRDSSSLKVTASNLDSKLIPFTYCDPGTKITDSQGNNITDTFNPYSNWAAFMRRTADRHSTPPEI